MSGGARQGAGRKLVKIDLEQLEKLCGLQCTDAEIAAWFHVSTRTIENRRKYRQFAEAMERGRAKGRISVRRHQMKLLEAGTTTRPTGALRTSFSPGMSPMFGMPACMPPK